MKKVLNYNNMNLLNENILSDEINQKYINDILSNNTSIGNNPAIPDIYDIPFLLKKVNIHFNEIKNKLKEIGKINDIKSNDIQTGLAELILKCKEIEKPYKDKLEKMCYNKIINMFSIPEDTIVFNIDLKNNIDISNNSITIEPYSDNDDVEFDDINDALNIKKEVYKRRILDTLCIGGSMSLASFDDEELIKINPKLPDLYNKIILLNEYLLFTENINITDKNNKQMGTVEVILGNKENKIIINSQGTIYPILLSETIHGLLELFISHGLPNDKNKALSIIRKSDFLKNEPWDMKIGPILWNLLNNSFNDIDLKELPYLLKRISTLEIDKFNLFMKEIFAKTKKGKQIMYILSKKAKNDMDYNYFIDKMDKMRIDKSVIIDEYIKEEEL